MNAKCLPHILKLFLEVIDPLIFWAVVFLPIKQHSEYYPPSWPSMRMLHKLNKQVGHFIKQVFFKSVLFRYSLIYLTKCDGKLLCIKKLSFTWTVIIKTSANHHGLTISNPTQRQKITSTFLIWGQFLPVGTQPLLHQFNHQG